MKTTIDGRLVEWDDNKNAINKRKHGISFETAALVFGDANSVEFYDEKHSIDEERYVILGLVNKVLFVVFTDRQDATRIISARVATAAERRIYYDYGTKNDF